MFLNSTRRKEPSTTLSISFVHHRFSLQQKPTSITHLIVVQLITALVWLCFKYIKTNLFRSRSFLLAEENYRASNQECLAFVCALKTKKSYLMY